MSKYKFKLETLQKVREARRDEHRAALAEAFRAEQVLAETRGELAAEAEKLLSFQRSVASEKYTDVNQLLEAQRYELLLRARSQELGKQAVLLAAETERRRQAVVESSREVRVLERLDERQQQHFHRAADQRETKRIDEIATSRWRLNPSTSP